MSLVNSATQPLFHSFGFLTAVAISLTAFGDSSGDIEMLNFADEGYYKPFRK